MKKIISLLLAVMILATLAAGCGNASNDRSPDVSSTQTKGNGTPENSEAKEPVSITFKTLAWLKAEQDTTKQVIDTWNAEHPEIQVEYVQGDWTTVDQELLTSFETGDVPDIFHYWTPPIMEWKERGFLADLTPMLDAETQNDILPDVWKLFTNKEGKIIALPFESEVDVMFYNKAMFKDAGIEPPTIQNPWTLDDLIANAKKLAKPDEGIWGLYMHGMHWGSRFVNDSWATKIGVSPVVKDGDKYVVKITDKYKDLLKKLHDIFYVDRISPAQVDGYDAKAAFLEGKCAIVAGVGNWMRSQYINENQGKNIDWGVLPSVKIKTQDTFAAIQTLSIPEKSKYKAEAMEFLKYFWNVENQTKIAQSAFIFPGRNSALDRPEFKTSEYGWDVAIEAGKHVVVPLHVTVPGWGQFMNGTGLTIYQEYLTNQISLNEFVKKVEEEGTRVLEEAVK